MLNDKMQRELAYVVKVDSVEPIEGYDRIELAKVNGWHCVVGKGMQAGDLAVYFEIDSLLPATDERFAFCSRYHYKIKTQKYCKGKVLSQGLLMPVSDFPEIADPHVGQFVTELLKVTYYDPADQKRKSNSNGESKRNYKPLYIKLARKYVWFRWLNKNCKPFNWLMWQLLGQKKKHNDWPEFAPKTDQERVQNMPWILQDTGDWIATEKVDGTSTTFAVRREKFGKLKFWVCSRNVVVGTGESGGYYDSNVYAEMFEKYHVKEFLTDFINKMDAEWVYLQGETFGGNIQKRDYSMAGHDFRAFHLSTNLRVRYTYTEMKSILDTYQIPTVPIIDDHFKICSYTVDSLLEYATGVSEIDGKEREGIVFQSVDDPTKSFKAVSNSFLLKYHS